MQQTGMAGITPGICANRAGIGLALDTLCPDVPFLMLLIARSEVDAMTVAISLKLREIKGQTRVTEALGAGSGLWVFSSQYCVILFWKAYSHT